MASGIVLALCLLSFARGVYELGEQSLWWDESLSLHRASRPFSFIATNRILVLYGQEERPITPDHHPPLYFALLRLVLLAAGKSEFALRYLSLASCVLIVPLLYQCGRRLYDRTTGVCAALLAACSPLYLWAQQEARPYALATLFAVISFYALMRTLGDGAAGSPSRSQPTGRKGWIALYMLSTAAMLVTHYHTLQLLPAYGAIYILARGHHKRRILWAVLATGIVAGGITLYGLREIMPPYQIAEFTFIPLDTLLQDILRAFPLGVSGTDLVFYQWVSAILLLAALGILFILTKGTSRRHAIYVLLCLALPVAEIYVISYVRPVYMNIRHVMFASPFYYLILAAGVGQIGHIRLGERVRRAIGAGASAAVGLLLVGMGLATHTFFVDPQYDKEDHRSWGAYLSEHVRPDDVVLIYPGAVYELYEYYAASPAPYYGIPEIGASTEQTIKQLVEIAQHHDRLWIAHSLTPSWAYAGNKTIEWLQENTLHVATARFGGHLNTFPVYAFKLDPPVSETLPEQASPLGLDFDGELHLRGFEAIANPVRAGEPLLLSLYWSAPQPLDQGYRFTISLTDEKGYSWASLDYVPYDGTYPPAQWPAKGLVRDDVDIDVPAGTPPGRYWVNVSVYPADRNSPALPVRDLESGRLMGLIVPVAEVGVARPEAPPAMVDLSIAQRTRARYGPLALLGHDYQGGTYQPGDVIQLDTYWRAMRAPRQDLTLALQLVDAGGEIRTSRPIAPAEGYPTSQWQRGEIVQGKHRFRFPLDAPAGNYGLWLAAGDGGTRSIWPWRGPRVRLDTLTLVPLDKEPAYEVPPIQQERYANLDDRVELLGYDLDQRAVQPGEVVSCTLYWRGLQEMEQNYTVFTHLTAPDGTTWGQWDNEPQRGQLPTTRWIPGQVIADPYQIPVSPDAPAGPLTLQVGMYDRRTMMRVPVLDESGAVVGDAIDVVEIEVVGGTSGD